MRRGRLLFVLLFVIILGLIGIGLIWFFLIRPSTATSSVPPTPTPKPVEILMITQNIARGTVLDETMLAPVTWPEDQRLPGMFNAEDLVTVKGRTVKYDLEAPIPLMSSMLLDENETIPQSGSPWAININKGMVAVSVPTNRFASLAYGLRPGDHVDVIASLMFVDVDTDFQTQLPNFTGVVVSAGPPDPEANEQLPLTVGVTSMGQGGQTDPETGQPIQPASMFPGIFGKVEIDPTLGQAVLKVPSEGQRPRITTHMLLRNVVVLQVGNFPLPGTEVVKGGTPSPTPEEDAGGGGRNNEEKAGPAVPDLVTLIVTPQDAVTLNYLMLMQTQLSSHLSLVLRSPNDNGMYETFPVTLQFLLSQYQIPVPIKLPYSLNPRIDQLVPPQ